MGMLCWYRLIFSPCVTWLYLFMMDLLYSCYPLSASPARRRVDKDRSGAISSDELQLALGNGKLLAYGPAMFEGLGSARRGVF